MHNYLNQRGKKCTYFQEETDFCIPLTIKSFSQRSTYYEKHEYITELSILHFGVKKIDVELPCFYKK